MYTEISLLYSVQYTGTVFKILAYTQAFGFSHKQSFSYTCKSDLVVNKYYIVILTVYVRYVVPVIVGIQYTFKLSCIYYTLIHKLYSVVKKVMQDFC